MEKLKSWYIDQEFKTSSRTLSQLFTEDFEKKELKRYTKIRNILPITDYQSLEYPEERTKLIEYLATKTDKRIKISECYISPNTFYTILKVFRDIEFPGASALEVKEIKKEFSFLPYGEVEELIQKLHSKNIVNWESRADLNQIRFHEDN